MFTWESLAKMWLEIGKPTIGTHPHYLESRIFNLVATARKIYKQICVGLGMNNTNSINKLCKNVENKTDSDPLLMFKRRRLREEGEESGKQRKLTLR